MLNTKVSFLLLHTGSLSSGIEQLRTCDRCHRIFPVLSDLFNHMCDDEDDLMQRKSAMSSSISSTKYPSDNSFHNANNHEKPTLDSQNSFESKSSPNQGSSVRSFKLNRRSSFNDSSIPTLRSKKLFSPPTSSSSSQVNSTYDTAHIPLHKRSLFRTDSTRIASSPSSSRTLYNDKPHHSSSAYVYLRHPASPMRVIS